MSKPVVTIFAMTIASFSLGAEADSLQGFDKYVSGAIADWGVPGLAVAVVKDDAVIFADGYGRRSVDGDGAVDTGTVFPIASITKTFNATALAMLVDEQRIGWNDPVVKHLPKFRLHDDYTTREVNIADLLSHRTCIEDPILLMYTGIDRRELIQRAHQLRDVAAFRSSCHYNNLMINVSGEILERITSRRWEEFVRDRIFKPLGMNSTVADVEELADITNRATVYVEIADDLRTDPTWTLPLSEGWRTYRQAIRPDGAICSNVDDLAKFLILHLRHGLYDEKRLLQEETALEMQALHSTMALKFDANSKLAYPKFVFGYGLGWEIRDYRGRKLVMHRGSTGAVLAMMPEENIGVVILANLNRGVQYMVMHDTFDRLLGIPRSWTNRDWVSEILEKERREVGQFNEQVESRRDRNLKSSLAPDEYVGTYQSSFLGDLNICQSDKGLHMRLGSTNNCQSQLRHWQGEQFRATFQIRHFEDWFVDFRHSDDGKVSHVTITDVRSNKPIGTFHKTDAN